MYQVTTLTFQSRVTSHSTHSMRFPIGVLLTLTRYLELFFSY